MPKTVSGGNKNWCEALSEKAQSIENGYILHIHTPAYPFDQKVQGNKVALEAAIMSGKFLRHAAA